jgi:hypothetical protein
MLLFDKTCSTIPPFWRPQFLALWYLVFQWFLHGFDLRATQFRLQTLISGSYYRIL